MGQEHAISKLARPWVELWRYNFYLLIYSSGRIIVQRVGLPENKIPQNQMV
jgi:hypothetical protein